MEADILMKIGTLVNWITTGGYAFASTYIVRTGFIYYNDYKESVANDED